MKKRYPPKDLFVERMKALIGDEYEEYWKVIQEESPKSIRVNTLKITPEELKKKLEEKGWKIGQPFKNYPEIIVIKEKLQPGELGRALEHLLGYFYVQEIASMLPVLVLNPQKNEAILDLCAAPGSKTSQIAARMENTGTIIANDLKLGRIKILASNLERCGVMNTIITKKDGIALCKRLEKENFEFDKILIDAPCSGEGTIRSVPVTLQMWSLKKIQSLSRLQKALLSSAIGILKVGGEIVYSTCTHAPEENEEVLDFILKEFDNIKVEKISLPVKCRIGISGWAGREYNKEVGKSCRVYPQDKDNTEGFFIAKLRKVK